MRSFIISFLKIISLFLLAIFISACTDSNEKSTTAVIGQEGIPTQTSSVVYIEGTFGAYSAKTVGAECVLSSTKNPNIVTRTTDANGFVNFDNVVIPQGVVTLTCSGGSYIDEATGNTISPSPTIHASMNYTSGPLTMVATPLSEVAYRLAVKNNDTKNINNYNKNVAKSFGLETTNLVAIKPIDLNDKAANDTKEGKVGLILAAISQMAQSGSSSDTQGVIEKLTLDLADGKLDAPDNNISKAFAVLTTSTNSKVAENIVASEAITKTVIADEQKQKSLLVTKISINGVSEALVGQSLTLTTIVEPVEATQKNVSWSVNDTSLATISTSGVIDTLSEGIVVVKAIAQDGSGVQSTKNITIQKEYSDVDYGIQSYEYGDRLSTLVFTNLGKGITNCTSTPSLPKGFLLSLNASGMCQVDGKATAISAKTEYKIVANGTKSSATFTVDVKVKPITVRADAQQSKIYGTQDEKLTYTISPALSYNDSLNGSMQREVGEDVGSYSITQGSLRNSNYIISFKGADFSILPKPITVTADVGVAKVYGEVEPQLTYSISPNLLFDESLSGVLSRDAGENVGSYAITQGTLSNPNYAINFVKANFQIIPKAITVTANRGQSKVYGDTDPILSYTTSTVVEGFQGRLGRETGEEIGSYSITQGTLSNANYTISFQPASFTIKMPKTATALINKLKSKLTTVENPFILGGLNGVVGVKFTTQLLGKKTTAVAFDINGTNDFVFISKIDAPVDEMISIADDEWIKDPSAVDKNSVTRKLDIYDLGFTKGKTFVYASNNLSLSEIEVPKEAQTLLQSIYGENFKIQVSEGLSLHNKIDINAIPEMRETLKFLASTDSQWGKSGASAYDATTSINISLKNNEVNDIALEAVVPSFEFHVNINAFDLQFGKFIRFNVLGLTNPLNVQPVLDVYRDKSSFEVSLNDADVEMPIFNKSVNSNLDVFLKTASIKSEEKRVAINILNNNDFPLFGANWLTFGPNGYGMHVEVPATDAAMTIKYLGQTELLGKYITFKSNQLLLGGASGAAVATLISPPTAGYIIHDGPGKIGGVPLNYMSILYAYMLEKAGANIDHNLFGNIVSPLKLRGILPEGETIESQEKNLGHPIGVSFEVFPDITDGFGISGVDFSAGLQLFDIEKSLADVRKFTVSKGAGIHVDASTTDFTLGDGSLFTMPNFTINVNVPGLKEILGGADISVDKDGTFGRNVINLIEGNAVGIAQAYNDVEIKLIGQTQLLTVDTNLTYIVTPYTQKTDFLMNFAGMNVNTKLYASREVWDPGMKYEMNFDTEELSAWANTGASKMKEQIGDMFSDINTGIGDIQKAIDKAQRDLDQANTDYNTIRAQAQRNKDKAEKPIRDAEAKVQAAADDLKSYDYNWYYKYSSQWSDCHDTFLFGNVCTTPPGRWAAYAPWQAGRGIYLGALSTAEGILWTIKHTISSIDIDAYPEVIAAAANVELAKQNLAAANDLAISYRAVSDGLQKAFEYATKVVDELFQLVSFKVYGGFGLNSIIGIAADTVILGQEYSFDVGAGSDLTYLRDNFIDIINKKIWQPISEMIANDSVSKESSQIYATQNIINHAPTGTIPDRELVQDNSKECNTTEACYALDIAQYISDADTMMSKLKFRAVGLPQHMRMDKHGKITGALSRNDIGTHLVKVNVSDDTFMSFNTSFHLNVIGLNTQHLIEVLTTHKEIDSQEINNSTNQLISTFATIKGDSRAVDYSKLAQVVVKDPDIGDTYKYEIIAGNDAGHFSIDTKGNISLNAIAEGDIHNNYNLRIRVTDNSMYAPKNLKAETDFAVDVKPIVWLESRNTIESEYPTFLMHIYPKPSAGNTNKYTVSYRVETMKLATDVQDGNNTIVASAVLQKEQQSGSINYGWNESKKIFLNIAKANRQIDRQYKIKLLNVEGEAYIDKSRDTLDVNVYAVDNSVKITPLNETPSRFTKLDLNGTILADDATDWACVRDDITGLMWTSRSRIKEHLPVDAYHPIGWDGSGYSTEYGYNLLYASFGEHTQYKQTRLLDNKIMSMQGYCGSQDINIPTVTELQSIVDYSKSAKMVNEVYFPDLDFTKPYLALRVDSYNRRQVYDNTNEFANVNSWQMNALYALPDIQNYAYLEDLGRNNSGYINFPLQDTPVELVDAFAQRVTLLNKSLATMNLDTGSVDAVKTNYVYNASYDSPTNGNASAGQIAPYFNGELMYVIYPKTEGQVTPFTRKDGGKDEDLSYIIRTLFSSEMFVQLN